MNTPMKIYKNKPSYKGKSMFRKVMIPMLMVAITQVLICSAIFSLSGTVKKLKNERYHSFHSMVVNRSEKMQELMLDKQEHAINYKEKLEEKIATSLAEKNKVAADLYTDNALNETITLEVANVMAEMLKESHSSGVFLMLEGYGDVSDLKYGYYLRNSKPGSTDKKDVSILKGTEKVIEEVELAVHNNWRSEFRMGEKQENNYYNKVYSLFKEQEDHNHIEMGYWSPIFTMYGDDLPIITYTLPLVDSSGSFYGILGIEISEQMFLNELFYQELSTGGDASYYLVHRNKEEDNYKAMVTSSGSGKALTNQNGDIGYFDYEEKAIVYQMEENLSGNYIGTIADMELYSAKSPFIEEQWALIGVVNEEDLLATYHRLMKGVIAALFVVIILGIFEIWYLCMRFSAYMRQMIYSIQTNAPGDSLNIAKVDVREIEELSRSVQQLHERGTSSAKLVEIIDMAGIPVGAIELHDEEEVVFCTQGAADILEFHHVDQENPYISRKAFEVEVAVLKKKLVACAEENTYRMTDKTGADKWVRLKYKKKGDRILIAVMDVTAENLERQKIEYERDYDILTRLLNRTAFRAKMGQLLKAGNLGIAAVVMMDLDNLKFFNDTYGHEYGDKYIREAAVVLSTLSQYRALVARMAGDEFLMFLYGYSDKDEIRKLVQDVHTRMKESYITVPSGENIRIRASAGIAWYPDDAVYLDDLIKFADFAMYETKGNKKGNIKEFNQENYLKDAVLFTGKEELNKLIEEEDMVRYIFQPIVEVTTGEIFGYEALMRPQIDSLRSPEDVMRLAKAQSKLYQIEKVTWMSALEAVERQRKPEDQFKIFINSVPNHVLEEADTQELENKYQHILERVIIEIIESEQTDKSCMETKCEWARKHRAEIALDDFGTGYSNESTLLYINPKYVKLDMSIINNIHKDESRQKIVQGLLEYTKSHGIRVIAEGIDSYEEMHTLIRLGVDYMQGWYLARGQFEMIDIPQDIKSKIRTCLTEVATEKGNRI